MLTYLNVLNLLMFVLKCFTYIYTRYVISHLYTVLIIPRDVPLSEENQEEQIGVQYNSENEYENSYEPDDESLS